MNKEYQESLDEVIKYKTRVEIPFLTKEQFLIILKKFTDEKWDTIRILTDNKELINRVKDFYSCKIITANHFKKTKDLGDLILFDQKAFIFIKSNSLTGTAKYNDTDNAIRLYDIFYDIYDLQNVETHHIINIQHVNSEEKEDALTKTNSNG